jgi:hypothetical protein
MRITVLQSICVLFLACFSCASSAQSADTIRVCRAGEERQCPPHDVFVGCATPVSEPVKEICKRVPESIVLQHDESGGMCGVSLYVANCDGFTTDSTPGFIRTTFLTIAAFLAVGVSFAFFVVQFSQRSVKSKKTFEESTLDERSSKLARWLAIIGGLAGLAASAWTAFVFFSQPRRFGLLDIFIPKAFATSESVRADIGWMIPYVAVAVLGLMGISFLTALGTILFVPDTKQNQARIKAADNIVKTFGGFFTGLATTLLK